MPQIARPAPRSSGSSSCSPGCPGLGPRSARRAALHLIKKRDPLLAPLSEAMRVAQRTIVVCSTCGNIDTADPCALCRDEAATRSLLVVVEDVSDLWALERAGAVSGRYHVLGGVLSPLDGVSPEHLNLDRLIARAAEPDVAEVLLALNATVDGQTTAHYVTELLAHLPVQVTKLAHGVPIGGELDYLDEGTLSARDPPAHRLLRPAPPPRGVTGPAGVAKAAAPCLPCDAGIPMSHADLARIIEAAWEDRADIGAGHRRRVREAVEEALALLDAGKARVAEKVGDDWVVHQWLKKAVLLSFRLNDMASSTAGPGGAVWWDKVPSKFDGWGENRFRAAGFRAVPGCVVRRGAYIAPGVVLMPSFVNLGAYVDEDTMVDTWATVGSCAQIGKNVHLSGGVGIGGVLEPLQANPTIIEDDCFIGARSEVVEGVVVGEGSVLSMGVFIGASTKIVDRDTGEIFRGARAALFGGRVRHAAGQAAARRLARARPSPARSSSSASTRRPAPRPASTSSCGTKPSRLPGVGADSPFRRDYVTVDPRDERIARERGEPWTGRISTGRRFSPRSTAASTGSSSGSGLRSPS